MVCFFVSKFKNNSATKTFANLSLPILSTALPLSSHVLTILGMENVVVTIEALNK